MCSRGNFRAKFKLWAKEFMKTAEGCSISSLTRICTPSVASCLSHRLIPSPRFILVSNKRHTNPYRQFDCLLRSYKSATENKAKLLDVNFCSVTQQILPSFKPYIPDNVRYTGWSKCLCAPDDYSTKKKNKQKYFIQFQSLTMIT
jgi:hypothetical protein